MLGGGGGSCFGGKKWWVVGGLGGGFTSSWGGGGEEVRFLPLGGEQVLAALEWMTGKLASPHSNDRWRCLPQERGESHGGPGGTDEKNL